MPLPTVTTKRLEEANLRVQHDALLARRSWWKAGGKADGMVTAKTTEELCAVRSIATETDCPLFVLGNGSNLLISDKGIRGMVVRLSGELAGVTISDNDEPCRLTIGGGTRLQTLVKQAAANGWSGLERLAGIPGTMGGAVRMNAGTHYGEVVDLLVHAELVMPNGQLQQWSCDALGLQYRQSRLPPGAIVAFATLQTTSEPVSTLIERIEHHLDYRAATQPIDVPTCGSTFRNPPNDKAGRLIESCGLKGHLIGGAQVSTKHANFLVNTGTATATDLRRLIEHVQATVLTQTGVQLEREVHFAGDWSDWG